MDNSKKELVAILDIDHVKYTASAAGETRSVVVTHLPSGRQTEFNNRTEFYGRDRSKSGGWLGELNKSREGEGKNPFPLEDFAIEDKQVAEPLQNVLHTVKMMIDSDIEAVGATSYKAFLGEGECFRVRESSILEYKGNRKDQLKPLLLNDVVEYIKKKYNPEIVTELEADDAVVMAAYKKPDHVVVGVDKDYYGQPVKFFNVNKPEEGIIDCDQFGKLWLENNKVRGIGRMFLYFQIASGDSADNYKANSASTIKWGEKSAYKELVNCENDQQALEALVRIYKTLYPVPIEITTWQGEKKTIDWLYVLEENWNMARMRRWEGDDIKIEEVLKKKGVNY